MKNAIDLMPKEFQDYVSVPITILGSSSDRHLHSLPRAHGSSPSGRRAGERDELAQHHQEDGQPNQHLVPSLISLHRRFANPVQAAAFLYTASTQGMTGEGWIYLGTDWNSVLTYAGLEKEYRETVRNAMNGMVGISPFVGDLDWMVTEINVIFGMGE